MNRCLQLAALGAGAVAPNPMVGSVLVHNDQMIGEGYHEVFGGPHAEVNCIHSVEEKNRPFIPESTLYVSLEPCAHFGKTPPCTDLILDHQIRKVVIGTRDPFPLVDGKGIEKLERAGVEVILNMLEPAAVDLNKRFFTYHFFKRPYIILKWAQTADGIIGKPEERLHISGTTTNRLVHRWRSEEAAILVGKGTVLHDDPLLTTRLWPGKNPVRMIIDPQCRLPEELRLFNGESETLIFNSLKSYKSFHGEWIQIHSGISYVNFICRQSYDRKFQSIIVEGGAATLQHFLDAGVWDEMRVITNRKLFAGYGVKSPSYGDGKQVRQEVIGDDQIDYFENPANPFHKDLAGKTNRI